MNSAQLEALLIDRSFGELSPEVLALLDAYLVDHPEASALSDQVGEALAATSTVVLTHPLVTAPESTLLECAPSGRRQGVLRSRPRWLPLGRLAATVMALGVASGLGYLVGSGTSKGSSEKRHYVDLPHEVSPSPWTSYHVADDGRLAITPSKKTTL